MYNIDFSLVHLILKSSLTTVEIFVITAGISIFLALLIDACEHVLLKQKSKLLAGIIFIIGATPELVVLFICYYGLLYLLKAYAGHYINCPPLAAGIISLSIIYTGYILPILHGSKLAIAKTQVQPAKNLGLSKVQIYKLIIMPQAIKHSLPGLTNLAMSLVKDTSLIFLIGGKELMGITQAEAISSGKIIPLYIAAMLIYLIICSVTEKIMLHLASNNLPAEAT